MTKAAYIFIGCAALVIFPGSVPAQDNGAIATADTEAVVRQANTVVLRQKLLDARALLQRGDIVVAAKVYQEACTLAEGIGSGIADETLQAVTGLTTTRMALARDAQARGDLHEADTQVKQVITAEKELKVSPNGEQVLAFKRHNDELLDFNKGRLPDTETVDKLPQLEADKVAAGTLVQDGKMYYEMGKFTEAELKLNEAIKLDPDNNTASYYLNVIKQDKIHRDMIQHNTDTQDRMEHVEKQWILPKSTANMPVPNSYATNTLVFTGPGRQRIMAKLDHIRIQNFTTGEGGMPLTEVLKLLAEQCRIGDPDRLGVNFLINNNPDLSGPPSAVTGLGAGGIGGAGGLGGAGGFGGVNPVAAAPAAPALDAMGMPVAPAGEAAGNEQDVGSFLVKIPNLTDVRVADVLDAIELVAEHPIKYSIKDFAVVFSAKGPETPQLFMQTYHVDPNTFYSGLENVSAQSFGAVQNNGSSGSSGGGGGGGGGGQNQNNGAVVGVVNAFSGSGGLRNTGTGGGGGGGGAQGGSGSLLNNGLGGGGGGNQQNAGGLAYITTQTSEATPSALARAFFTTLGVNLINPPGKSVFFNDRLGLLFVKATESDLETIERALQILNQVPPQVHIKARFIEVSQNDNNQLGMDWYLGQFNLGNQAVAQGGNPGSLTVPTTTGSQLAANPLGVFPGATAAQQIADQGQSLFSSGLTSGPGTPGSTTATITGILTNPNFQVVLHALQSRSGVETLGEPEITVISGRQTQMRATSVVTVVIGLNFQQGTAATTTTGTGATP